MADAEVPIAEVVELLAERWHARCRDLDNYLRSTFGVPAPKPIPARLHLLDDVLAHRPRAKARRTIRCTWPRRHVAFLRLIAL